jgi:hypothetical protein
MEYSKDELELYLVTNGEVSVAASDAEWDGVDSVLVLAPDKDVALKLADAYDRRQIGADNMVWRGETIAVVSATWSGVRL